MLFEVYVESKLQGIKYKQNLVIVDRSLLLFGQHDTVVVLPDYQFLIDVSIGIHNLYHLVLGTVCTLNEYINS